jgi:hypothetical protein
MSIDQALVGAAATGDDDMVVVATDDAHDMTPAESFIEQVTKAREPPLLELPRDDSAPDSRPPPALPKRSRRLAA